jgi:hypothetical protein
MTDYTNRFLDEIEVDGTYPLPQMLSMWAATGCLNGEPAPIPNPYLSPKAWADVEGISNDDIVQAWAQRKHHLMTDRNWGSVNELEAMLSVCRLQRAAMEKHIALDAAQGHLKVARQDKDAVLGALYILAQEIQEWAVDQDWCGDYEGAVNDYIEKVNDVAPFLTGELVRRLERKKMVSIVRYRWLRVKVRETLVDVEVPYGVDEDSAAQYIPEDWEDVDRLSSLRDVLECENDDDRGEEFEVEEQ